MDCYLPNNCCICFSAESSVYKLSISTDGTVSYYNKLIETVTEMVSILFLCDVLISVKSCVIFQNFKELNEEYVICTRCKNDINTIYIFRQRCLQNKFQLIELVTKLQCIENSVPCNNKTKTKLELNIKFDNTSADSNTDESMEVKKTVEHIKNEDVLDTDVIENEVFMCENIARSINIKVENDYIVLASDDNDICKEEPIVHNEEVFDNVLPRDVVTNSSALNIDNSIGVSSDNPVKNNSVARSLVHQENSKVEENLCSVTENSCATPEPVILRQLLARPSSDYTPLLTKQDESSPAQISKYKGKEKCHISSHG